MGQLNLFSAFPEEFVVHEAEIDVPPQTATSSLHWAGREPRGKRKRKQP
jgi:hypothetical protein